MTHRVSKIAVAVLMSLGMVWTAATVRAGEAAGEAALTDTERAAVVELLERSREEMHDLVKTVKAEDWYRKPAEDAWSVGEVVEHLLLAEELLYGRVEERVEQGPKEGWHSPLGLSDDELVGGVSDRSRKLNAPDFLQPTGEIERKDLLRRFKKARGETLALARTTDAPLKACDMPHPLGEMDARQFLVFIAGHNMRHNRQIAEVKATLGL